MVRNESQSYQFKIIRFDGNNLLKNHDHYMVSKGFVATICANNFISRIVACITLQVHLFAYVPCIISLWVHFLAYIPCNMSLWVYFLAYAPCSKGEHVNNIRVPSYVLKGIPIWLILLSLIFNSKGLTFFYLRKNLLGSCNNSPFRLLSWILKLLASEGVHVETKLGSTTSPKKFNSITICLVAFTHLDFRRGQHFLSLSQYVFLLIHL